MHVMTSHSVMGSLTCQSRYVGLYSSLFFNSGEVIMNWMREHGPEVLSRAWLSY